MVTYRTARIFLSFSRIDVTRRGPNYLCMLNMSTGEGGAKARHIELNLNKQIDEQINATCSLFNLKL